MVEPIKDCQSAWQPQGSLLTDQKFLLALIYVVSRGECNNLLASFFFCTRPLSTGPARRTVLDIK